MDPDQGGEQEGVGGVGGIKGIGDADNANEKDAAWSFVSFSSEKETKVGEGDEGALASSLFLSWR